MKPADIGNSIGLDRLSTRIEYFDALSLLSQGSFDFAGEHDDFREMGADSSGRACGVPKTTCGW